MKFQLYLSILTLLQTSSSFFQNQFRIRDLDKTNFEAVISSNPYTLVEFYAPWCPYCKEFVPEYEKVAKILRDKNVPVEVAKVDATSEKDIANEQHIDAYPTMKLFKNGKSFKYDGQRQAEDIYRWLLRNTDQTY